jgi:hypothetical protein
VWRAVAVCGGGGGALVSDANPTPQLRAGWVGGGGGAEGGRALTEGEGEDKAELLSEPLSFCLVG